MNSPVSRDSKLYFDTLPYESLIKIARFLQDCHPAALAFAHGSNERRCAVMEAFDYRLHLRIHDTEIFQDLLESFGDLVQDISLIAVETGVFLKEFPSFPSLRKAQICADDEQLQIITSKPGLSQLEVEVGNYTNWETVATTFESLPLSALKIDLPCKSKGPNTAQQLQLAAACANLEKVELSGAKASHMFWTLITNLPSLRCLSLSERPMPHMEFDFLRTLEEVELHRGFSIKEAGNVGAAVKKLRTSRTQDMDELAELSHCKNLRELLIAVEDGAETQLLGKLSHLESLDLRWGEPPYWREYSYYRIDEEEIFYEPDGNLLLDLVKGSPKLRELSLEQVLVDSFVLEMVIQSMGDRLERIGIQMSGQDEHILPRLEAVLIAISRWCPNIRTLALMGMSKPLSATRQQLNRCLVAFNTVRRMCLKLNTDSVSKWVGEFCIHPRRTRHSSLHRAIVRTRS